MCSLSKVIRLKVFYLICVLILLTGQSFQIGHKDEISDASEIDEEEFDVSMNTCAANFDSEEDIASSEAVRQL